MPEQSLNNRMSDFVVLKGSAIWEYYLRETTGRGAKCRYCRKILKTSNGSTEGLHTHIQSQHPERYAGSSKDGTSQGDSDQPQPAAERPGPWTDTFKSTPTMNWIPCSQNYAAGTGLLSVFFFFLYLAGLAQPKPTTKTAARTRYEENT